MLVLNETLDNKKDINRNMDKDSYPDILVRETQSQEDSFFEYAQRVDNELTNYFVEETQQETEDTERSECINPIQARGFTVKRS